MNFEDYLGDHVPTMSIQELLSAEPDTPEEVTAEEIEAERQVLVSRYECADHEMAYDFHRLSADLYLDPENNYGKYSAVWLRFTMCKYIEGVLSNRVVSERVVAVPGHISTRVMQIRADEKRQASL